MTGQPSPAAEPSRKRSARRERVRDAISFLPAAGVAIIAIAEFARHGLTRTVLAFLFVAVVAATSAALMRNLRRSLEYSLRNPGSLTVDLARNLPS